MFTLLLVHLILPISPHHSHHLRSHHLSLPQPFTPDLKLISFTNPFLHSHPCSFRTAFTDLLTCMPTVLKGTGFVRFSFWLRVLGRAEYSALESTLNSAIVSYRIVRLYCAGCTNIARIVLQIIISLTVLLSKRQLRIHVGTGLLSDFRYRAVKDRRLSWPELSIHLGNEFLKVACIEATTTTTATATESTTILLHCVSKKRTNFETV